MTLLFYLSLISFFAFVYLIWQQLKALKQGQFSSNALLYIAGALFLSIFFYMRAFSILEKNCIENYEQIQSRLERAKREQGNTNEINYAEKEAFKSYILCGELEVIQKAPFWVVWIDAIILK